LDPFLDIRSEPQRVTTENKLQKNKISKQAEQKTSKQTTEK
jgi:hypothetical protein